MNLIYQPAVNTSLDELAEITNSAFQGYIGGEIHMTAALMAFFITQNNVDLNLSQIALLDDTPLGIAMVARRGWTSRLAMMGIVTDSQEKGVGKAFMQKLIELSQTRGDHAYELECFEQNERGVRLYQGAGFTVTRRLLGYQLDNPAAEDDADLTEIDIYDVARMVVTHGAKDLPWQLSGSSLMRSGPPHVGLRLGEAYAIISSPEHANITLRALIVPPPQQRQEHGSRLLRALFARYPGKHWNIPPICPEEFDGFLTQYGFVQQTLNQFQMRMEY